MAGHTPLLTVKSPVPSDIDIAQSVEPLHIAKIAEAVGLLPDEYDLYGVTKAKASAKEGWARQACCMQRPMCAKARMLGRCASPASTKRGGAAVAADPDPDPCLFTACYMAAACILRRCIQQRNGCEDLTQIACHAAGGEQPGSQCARR